MKIIPIGARQTNLMYVIIGRNDEVVFVDPVDAPKACRVARQSVKDIQTAAVFITHHHEDHSGGNKEMAKEFPNIKIYAGSARPIHTDICRDGDSIEIGTLEIRCIHTPCHTLDSFTYFVRDKKDPLNAGVFTGDTLFYLGCGKFFEGTGEMMHQALKKIACLPGNTLVYYGHDYKEKNIRFRKSILERMPTNINPKEMFLSIEEERERNLFMNPSLLDERKDFKELGPVERIQALREMKNSFDANR